MCQILAGCNVLCGDWNWKCRPGGNVRTETKACFRNPLRERFDSLCPREREIVIQVARGRLSKQIAHHLGIAKPR
jgi:DNA-binding NarL/FixJ family response regulator